MATRQVESTHHESPGADSPSEPRRSSPEDDRAQAGLPPDENQDDAPNSDQDIDTAGTEADEQSPTRSLFLARSPSPQRG